MHEQVVQAYPPESGQVSHLLVRDVRFLVLPVNDLGGGNRESLKPELLDAGRQQQGGPVEEEIELAVVVEVKRRGFILDIFKDSVDQSLSESDSPVEFLACPLVQEEFIPDPCDIRHPEERNVQVQGEFPEVFGVFLLLGHESPLY